MLCKKCKWVKDQDNVYRLVEMCDDCKKQLELDVLRERELLRELELSEKIAFKLKEIAIEKLRAEGKITDGEIMKLNKVGSLK